MARIFISYRREDSDIWVSRLVDELRKHFTPEQVFQDIASIDPGADFVEALDKALSTAAVMLAVIGQRWLSATDKQGRRRLDMPGDFVRQEIAESLRRPGVRVFPLLVNGAEMPAEEELLSLGRAATSGTGSNGSGTRSATGSDRVSSTAPTIPSCA